MKPLHLDSLALSLPFQLKLCFVLVVLSLGIGDSQASGFFKSSRHVVPTIQKKQLNTSLMSLATSQSTDFKAEFRVYSPSPGVFSQDGMQGLSYTDIEKVAGFDVRGTSLTKLSIWTSRADTNQVVVPNSITSPTDNFNEVPIWTQDANRNGLFDEGDSIMFFGHGSSIWQQVNDPSYELKYQLSHSHWGDYQSYYLGVLQSSIAQSLDTIALSGAVTDTLNYLWNYRHAEKETTLRDDVHRDANGGGIDDSTGVEWHWIFIPSDDESVYSVNHPNTSKFPGYDGDSAYAWVKYYPGRERGTLAASHAILSEANRLAITTPSSQFLIDGVEQTKLDHRPYMGKFLFQLDELQVDSRNFGIQVDLSSNFNQYNHRFDAYTIGYKGKLNYDSAQPYILTETSESQNLAIELSSDLSLIKLVNYEASNILPIRENLHIDPNTIESGQYFIWDKSIKTPEVFAITNSPQGAIQNLSTLESGTSSQNDIEYLIITPSKFVNSSLKLSELRSSGRLLRSMKTGVVEVEKIFMHYSGGRASPLAIRDYLRHVRSLTGASLKYLLLVGDTHYDVRNLLAKDVDIHVPIYEFEDYATDDFYAILDPGEYLLGMNYSLDLAVGRLPVSTTANMDDYLDKLSNFSEKGVMNQGFWRSQILLSADDFAQNGNADNIGADHMKNSEIVSKTIENENPWLTQTKVYIDDYASDASFQKPTAQQDIIRKLDHGQLFFNYFGHGSSDQIADENLFNDLSVNQIRNEYKTPIFSAFSCTVGRVDRINGTTLSQELFNEGLTGAIATVAASRSTYNSDNREMASVFFENMFDFSKDLLLGEALRKTKESIAQTGNTADRWNAEKYILLGEPVLTIPKPRLEINFESLPDTIQALEKVQIRGQVTGASKSGKIYLKVNEQASIRFYPGLNEGTFDDVYVQQSGKTLYAEVLGFKNGEFSTEFITPRKLSFGDTNAVIQAYAWEDKQPYYGAVAKSGISLNGTSSDASSIKDNEAPIIKAYPCDVNPVTTGYYGSEIEISSPACIEFEVSDETGIDLSEEVDEGVTVEVSEIYTRQHANFEILQGKRATFRLELGISVAPGEYTLEVRALDILGNFNSHQWLLKLSNESVQLLTDVYNVPNPMKKRTRFFFKTHSNSEVKIKVFDQNGRLVRILNNAVSGVTVFNGRDRYGRKLANGVYFYKVITRRIDSKGLQVNESKLEKLLISR